mgnify:CR=1 FL=1
MDILPRFYVYVLCRPDGRPFYVGKGQGNRINAHESFARNGYKSKRYSIIRKIWREGGEIFKSKVFETDNEDEAYVMEQALIAAIGRKYLANESDGGEGNRGYKPTDEIKAKISAATKGRKMSPETWARVQAAKVGKPRSEECKAKIRANLTGRKLPPEHVAASAAGNKGKRWSEQTRQNILDGMRNSKKVRPSGDAHHRTKWSNAQVLEVQRLYKSGIGPAEIARRTGIPYSTIKNFIHPSAHARKQVDSDDRDIPT